MIERKISIPGLLLAAVCLGANPICGMAVQQLTAKTIRARIRMPDGTASRNIKVKLEQDTGGSIKDGFTDTEGNFDVQNVAPGVYILTVPTDGQVYETASERIDVNKFSADTIFITINLSPKNVEAGATTGTGGAVTSVGEAANVPKEARAAYRRAVKLSAQQNSERAVIELKRAISLCPTYIQAYNDLGIILMKLGKVTEAIDVLTRAVQIDAKAFNPRLNLGIARVRASDFAGAHLDLIAARSLDPSSSMVHLYLGIVSMKLGDLEGAEGEFKRATSLGGTAAPVSHFYLAQVYLERDRRPDAIQEFETYLKLDRAGPYVAKAREQLAALGNKQQ